MAKKVLLLLLNFPIWPRGKLTIDLNVFLNSPPPRDPLQSMLLGARPLRCYPRRWSIYCQKDNSPRNRWGMTSKKFLNSVSSCSCTELLPFQFQFRAKKLDLTLFENHFWSFLPTVHLDSSWISKEISIVNKEIERITNSGNSIPTFSN